MGFRVSIQAGFIALARATYRLCRCCDGFHDIRKPWPHNCLSHFGEPAKRSDFATPYFISDTMDGVQSPVSGKYYTSKSELRNEYRAAGVIEIGNEPVRPNREIEHGPSEDEIAPLIAQAYDHHSS